MSDHSLVRIKVVLICCKQEFTIDLKMKSLMQNHIMSNSIYHFSIMYFYHCTSNYFGNTRIYSIMTDLKSSLIFVKGCIRIPKTCKGMAF